MITVSMQMQAQASQRRLEVWAGWVLLFVSSVMWVCLVLR